MKFKNFLFLIVLIKTEVVTDLSTTITFPSLSQNIERYEEIEARKRQAIEYIKLIEKYNLDERDPHPNYSRVRIFLSTEFDESLWP